MFDEDLRKALADFSDARKIRRFSDMIDETRRCMADRKRKGLDFDTDLCEVAELSQKNHYTFHTHPHGVRRPSGLDIQTTKRLNKKLICLGLVPSKEILCYDKDGKRIVKRFKL